MQDIQFKSNNGQFNIDEAQGIVECFVAGIGNKDSVGDIVVAGAFQKSLTRRKPRVVWGHNWNDPIGKVLEIYEVPPNDPRLPQKMKIAGIGGLYAKVQFNLNSEKGREAFTNVAFFGEEQEWSIGYKTLDAIFDNSRQANVLREVELYELSPVLHGANQLTGTISVKSEEEKVHMYPMGSITAVAVQEPKAPNDPFAQGIAQPADSDRILALQQELTSRTGGPIKVMKATESSVLFVKPGKGIFRLGYYFDGSQWMFGKPEQVTSPIIMERPAPGMPTMNPGMKPAPKIPNFPNVQRKPNIPSTPLIPVKYGDSNTQSGFFDASKSESENELDVIFNEKLAEQEQKQIAQQLLDIANSLQSFVDVKTEEDAWLIPCAPENAFETKQALDPLFDFHRIETVVTEDGILLVSPLNDDAQEALGVATKNLLGRIGRGLLPGGGGKVRRGRTALAKIRGELDPRKRRDVDNDGVIFDGTWREMPAPAKTPSLGLASTTKPDGEQTGGSRFPTKKWWQQWAEEKPPRKVVPFFIPRVAKPKVIRMFEKFMEQNDMSDLGIIAEVANLIKTAPRHDNATNLPKMDEKTFEEFKQKWPQVREKFAAVGGKSGSEKGRTAFEMLDTLVNTGEYERKNVSKAPAKTTGKKRVTPKTNVDSKRIVGQRRLFGGIDTRAGQAAAQREKRTGYPKNLENPPFRIEPDPMQSSRKKISYIDRGQNLLKPYIDIGIFPEDFDKMDFDTQYAWFVKNREALKTRDRGIKWQTFLEKFDDYLLDESLRRESGAGLREIERERRPRPQVSNREPAKPDTPKPEEKKPTPKASPRKSGMSKLERDLNIYREVFADFIKKHQADKEKVGSDFETVLTNLMDRVIALAFPDDGGDNDQPNPESVKEALDELDEGLREIAKLKNDVRNNKFNKPEAAIHNKLFEMRALLDDFGGERRSDTQEDLGEEDMISGAGASGRRLDRSGRLEQDDDDPDEFDVGRDEDNLDYRFDLDGRSGDGDEDEDDDDDSPRTPKGSLSSSTTLNSSISKARRFQRTQKLQKQGGRGLSSSTTSPKQPRTEVTNESTWWKKVNDSLGKEIREAESKATKKGLTILQEKIQKNDAAAFTPNSKRTNVGSIKISADEADQILDAVMEVIDRQKTAGKGGGVGSRGEIFAELLEKIASAAMSTFVDKTTKPIDDA